MKDNLKKAEDASKQTKANKRQTGYGGSNNYYSTTCGGLDRYMARQIAKTGVIRVASY